jgi:hypothetical protein
MNEAGSLMDEADRIMWDKKFTKAHDLYSEAYVTFQEVDDEFGEAFCRERLEYITQRMPEETTGVPILAGYPGSVWSYCMPRDMGEKKKP